MWSERRLPSLLCKAAANVARLATKGLGVRQPPFSSTMDDDVKDVRTSGVEVGATSAFCLLHKIASSLNGKCVLVLLRRRPDENVQRLLQSDSSGLMKWTGQRERSGPFTLNQPVVAAIATGLLFVC